MSAENKLPLSIVIYPDTESGHTFAEIYKGKTSYSRVRGEIRENEFPDSKLKGEPVIEVVTFGSGVISNGNRFNFIIQPLDHVPEHTPDTRDLSGGRTITGILGNLKLAEQKYSLDTNLIQKSSN